MTKTNSFKIPLLILSAIVTGFIVTPHLASAHCDTLDGPVIQDARKAIEARDITPILKWVKPDDEKTVRKRLSTGACRKGKEFPRRLSMNSSQRLSKSIVPVKALHLPA